MYIFICTYIKKKEWNSGQKIGIDNSYEGGEGRKKMNNIVISKSQR